MANTTGKKFGGRKKGTPNKTTVDTRRAYQQFVEGRVESLDAWLDALDAPEKKLDFMLKFSEYFIPKLARTETHGQQTVTHLFLPSELMEKNDIKESK